jgi:anti-anti-sigma factor
MTRVELADQPGQRVVTLSGPLDVYSSSLLARQVFAGLPTDAHDVLLDLHALSVLDSAGVSALMKLRSQGRSRAVDVRFHLGEDCPLHESVQDVVRRILPCDDPDPSVAV